MDSTRLTSTASMCDCFKAFSSFASGLREIASVSVDRRAMICEGGIRTIVRWTNVFLFDQMFGDRNVGDEKKSVFGALMRHLEQLMLWSKVPEIP